MKKKQDHRAMWNESQIDTLLYAAACSACHCMHCAGSSKSGHCKCVIDESSALKSFLGLINQTMNDKSIRSKHMPLPMTNDESILDLIYQIFLRSGNARGGGASEHNLGSTSKMWTSLVERYKKAKSDALLFKLDRQASKVISHFERRQLHYLFADLERAASCGGDQQVMASPAAVELETPTSLKRDELLVLPASKRGTKRQSTTSLDDLTQLATPLECEQSEVTRFGAQQRPRPLVYDYHRSHSALSDDDSMDEDTVSYDISSPNSPAAMHHSMSDALSTSHSNDTTTSASSSLIGPVSNAMLSDQLNAVSRQMAEQSYQFEHGLDELEHLVASDLKHTNKDLLLQQSRLGLCMDRIDSLYVEQDRHLSRLDAIDSSIDNMGKQFALSASECQLVHQTFVPRHEFDALQQKLNDVNGEVKAVRSMTRDAILASTAWPETEPIDVDIGSKYEYTSPQYSNAVSEERIQQMIDHAVFTSSHKALSENRIQQMIDQAIVTKHKALNDRIRSSQEESQRLILEWTRRELEIQAQRQLMEVQQVQAQVAAFTHNFNKREVDTTKPSKTETPPAPTPNVELYGVYKLQQDVEQLRSDTKNVHSLLERLLDFHQQHPPPKPRKRAR